MKDFLMTTYTIVLPVLMGYIVWLLKEQKRTRDANSAGTLCLLRDKLMYYHDKYVEKNLSHRMRLRIGKRCIRLIKTWAAMV